MRVKRATLPLELIVFAAVAYAPAYALDYAVILPLMREASKSPGVQILLLLALLARMYTPALGAAAAYLAAGKPGSLLDWLGVRVRGLTWIGLGALAVLVAYTIALPVSALAGLRLGACGPLEDSGPWIIAALLMAGVAAGLTVNAVAAFGEEAGWRGYLLVRLSSVAGFWPSALVVGVVWGLWHAPLVINGYDYSVSALEGCGGRAGGLVALAVFTAFTTAAGLVAALLRVGSGGAIAPAAMHGTINGIAGLYASLVSGSRLVAPPAGLAVAAGFALVAPLVWWAVRSLAEEGPG